jgi:hypothetical protein
VVLGNKSREKIGTLTNSAHARTVRIVNHSASGSDCPCCYFLCSTLSTMNNFFMNVRIDLVRVYNFFIEYDNVSRSFLCTTFFMNIRIDRSNNVTILKDRTGISKKGTESEKTIISVILSAFYQDS